MTHELKNKVALVTGASRGLGKAIAVELAGRSAKVALNYFGSPDLAAQTEESIRAAGGIAQAFRADVREESEVARMVAETEKALGPIDILVLNATGPQPFLSIEETSWRDCLDQLEFFVKSPLLFVKAVIPGMKARRRGRIINIGSEVFETGVPNFASYVSAKGAQLGLTRSWAMELAEFGITVNLIAPGWIPTERHATVPQESKDGYAATVPMKRMGIPRDIAQTVAFLAGDGASFITGQKISVNGGHSLS
jgi:3-oxoacyl-[acyl-carrier protein] reductase